MSTRIAAVVPVLDEVTAIPGLVAGLRDAGACCVYVVDGGSRDGTAAAAASAGATVIAEPRRGYGRACLTGAAVAFEAGAGEGGALGAGAGDPGPHRHDGVAFLDGDGSCDPADLIPLVAALEEVDVALGRRRRDRLERGAMPWHARLGNALVARMIATRVGRPVHDLPPFKAIRRAAHDRLALDDASFGWTVQFVARALREPDLRIVEVPVAFRRRQGGVSKVSGSVRASVAAGRSMLTVAVRETRARPPMVLVAKAPRPGHAKTRLAADLGEGATAELWAACLGDAGATLRLAAERAGARRFVVVPNQSDVDPVAGILGPDWPVAVQSGPGLAAALVSAFLAAHDGGADRAVVVAGDSPSLPPDEVQAALRVLDRRGRAVLGPTADGGYHLVGLRWTRVSQLAPGAIRRAARRRLERRLRAAFSAAAMGRDSALAATERALAASGWRVVHGASWPDLDTIGDLRGLAATFQSDGRVAPRTSDWIARNQTVIEHAWNRHQPQMEENG